MSYNVSMSGIHVFPLAKSRIEDRAARLFYEDNIANIVRQVVDTAGFIIKPAANNLDLTAAIAEDKPEDETKVNYQFSVNSEFSFNIYGYYFTINPNSTVFMAEFDAEAGAPHDGKKTEDLIADVYAYIDIDKSSKEILGQDNKGVYTGLNIVDGLPAGSTDTDTFDRFSLHLFKIYTSLDSESNRIFRFEAVTESYIKSKAPSLDIPIKRIDGYRDLRSSELYI